ncbi:MAG TPA: serine O-acetyltransferase [Paucimonas sp.]|nr:serine O-acetyltransferase [Paucimonas sp.]
MPPDAVDGIWRDVRDAAADVASREPLLRQRLHRLVLDRSSLADAIGAILSDRLASADMSESSLYGLMNEILGEDDAILLDIVTDMHALKNRDPACMNHLHGLLNMKGFHALQTYRIAHALWKRERRELAFVLSNKSSVVFCVDIHPAARIGCGVMLDHGSGIVIGETAVVDDNVSILQNVTLGGTGKEHGDRHPKVRCGVMLGAGAKILGNIEIGAMSKVAAGSVVLEAVPPHCTVAGVPAKIVRWHQRSNMPALDMDQSVKN